MLLRSVSPMMSVDWVLTGLFCLLTAPVDDFDIVIQDGCDDGNHVSFHDARSDVLSAPDTNVHHTLKCQIPLPHAHHILTSTMFQDTDQALDSSINSEYVADPG